jgi:IclR family transcriptional regulator, acetate operon repressor
MPPRSSLSVVPSVTRGLKRGSARAPKDAGGGVQSLTRGLTLLEQLADSEGGISLTEISQRTSLAPSTAHRLLNTLADMGFVFQAPDSGLWYIGLKTYRVGCAFVSNRDFVGESHAYLRKLMEQSGETANLSIIDGTHVCFIAQVQCHEVMRMQSYFVCAPGRRARDLFSRIEIAKAHCENNYRRRSTATSIRRDSRSRL